MLNIKNQRAHDLASRLSALTGQSLTAVVVNALEESLARETSRREPGKSKKDRILEFADRFRKGMPSDVRSADHADMYGEDGLPK